MHKPSKSASPALSATEPDAPASHRLILAVICFLAGAAIMVIEITAYRLLAPLFGNSAFTWTALIGVILMAFSAGGYLGGWLAEKKSDFSLLGWLLAGAAVLTLFVPAINAVVVPGFEKSGLIAGPLMVALLLFGLPGILLGAVSPASVRLYSLLGHDSHVGISAGTISMLGSLGSFVGTLLSGFYLLSTFGVKSIFIGTGLVLMALSITAFFLARNPAKTQLPIWIAGALAAFFGATTPQTTQANMVYQHDSYYHRIQVMEQGQGASQERFLHLDSTLEGGMRMSDCSVVLDYQHFWQLPAMKSGMDVKRALFIGAGAFGMPEQLSKKFPNAIVDVIEIDPQVIETGRKFFRLDEFPGVKAHAGDARQFLRQQSDVKYDFIFGDAYNGIRQIPVHLASKEFFKLVHDRLSPQGIFLMNIISAIEGPRSELLAGMIASVQESFKNVDLFAVGGALDQPQNALLLASEDSWSKLFTDASYVPNSAPDRISRCYVPLNRWPARGVVFTDDLNPVDAIIARGLWRE